MKTCASHLEQHDCPWGCGVRLDLGLLAQHKSECLMDPRKLMAAVQQLARENERLTLENQRLRDDSAAEQSDTEQRVRKVVRRRIGPGMSVD